jgi:hypothetical protein
MDAQKAFSVLLSYFPVLLFKFPPISPAVRVFSPVSHSILFLQTYVVAEQIFDADFCPSSYYRTMAAKSFDVSTS